MINLLIIVCFYCENSEDIIFLQNCLKSLSLIAQNIPNHLLKVIGHSNLDLQAVVNDTQNRGKSAWINEIIKTHNDAKFVWYLDGDIDTCPISEKIILEIMDFCASNDQIGLVAFNMKEDNRHNLLLYHQSEAINFGNLCLLQPNDAGLIAYGSFICKATILQKYQLPNVGSYGPEDTLLAKTLQENCFKCYIVQNQYIIHPKKPQQKTAENKNILIKWFSTKQH